MLTTIILSTLLHFARSASITLYGDVFEHKEFFVSTLPWLIDNIGGEIMVDYQLLGSGRYSVHQMCALMELSQNTFLQAQYLKCEAEGNPSSFCLCETGIDELKFKECVNRGGSMAAYATSKFKALKLGVAPVIELGPNNTVFAATEKNYLRAICTIFGDNRPLGCDKPFACNHNETVYVKRPVAQFDKDCNGGKYAVNECVCPDGQGLISTTTLASV